MRIYCPTGISFTTSKLASNLMTDADNSNNSWTSAKYYDDQGVELTVQADLDSSCVKSVLFFKPPFTYWLRVQGKVMLIGTPSIRTPLHIIQQPNIAKESGGQTSLVLGGLDLRFVDKVYTVVNEDTMIEMPYNNGDGSNEIGLIIYHAAGEQLEVGFELQILPEAS